MTTNVEQMRQVRSVTIAGMAVNLFLVLVKFAAGILGGSQAIIADAVHSLSDMTTDLAVIFGVHFWSQPPDQSHPYGHRRIETAVTLFVAAMLVVAGIGIGYHSLETVREPDIASPGWIASIAALISIVAKEIVFRLTISVGKKLRSGAVIANAWHHRSDALSSIPAFIAAAVAAVNPSLAFVDHIGAVIVSLFILKVAWDIGAPAAAELVDRGVSASERDLIRTVALETDQVHDVHAIRTRKLGSGVFVDLHVLVDPGMTVHQGHEIAELVKHRLIEKGSDITDVVVHIEPFEPAEIRNPEP
jgi:cation diffusion facilitator family transporter